MGDLAGREPRGAQDIQRDRTPGLAVLKGREEREDAPARDRGHCVDGTLAGVSFFVARWQGVTLARRHSPGLSALNSARRLGLETGDLCIDEQVD